MTERGEYMTLDDASKEFKKSVSALRNWLRLGLIKRYRKPMDRKVYVKPDEIRAVLNAPPTAEGE